MKRDLLIALIPTLLLMSNVAYAEPDFTVHWDQQYERCSTCKRVPEGYTRIKGKIPVVVVKAAKHIRARNNPIGTYTPFSAKGMTWIALDEYHRYTFKGGAQVYVPRGLHGVTVFKKEGSK